MALLSPIPLRHKRFRGSTPAERIYLRFRRFRQVGLFGKWLLYISELSYSDRFCALHLLNLHDSLAKSERAQFFHQILIGHHQITRPDPGPPGRQPKDQNGALFEQRQTRTWGTSAQTPQTMLAGTASLEAPQAYLMEALGSLDHVG